MNERKAKRTAIDLTALLYEMYDIEITQEVFEELYQQLLNTDDNEQTLLTQLQNIMDKINDK